MSLRSIEFPFGRYLILIVVAIVSITPFIYMGLLSLMSLGEVVSKVMIPSRLMFENYEIAWKQANFSIYLINSVIVTCITAVAQLIICAMAGYAFAQIRIRGRELLFSLVLITLMIPEAVLISPLYQIILGRIIPIDVLNIVTILLLLLCLTVSLYLLVSIINNRLRHELHAVWIVVPLIALIIVVVGFLVQSFDNVHMLLSDELADKNWLNTFTVMIVPFLGNAYSIFLFRQFFKQLPDELWQAARLDGASHFHYFIRVAVPLNLPAFAIIGLLSFIWSWNALMWPRLTQLDRTGHFTLPVGLDAFNRDAGVDLHLLMAGAVISVIPVLILYIVTLRLFITSVSRAGIRN